MLTKKTISLIRKVQSPQKKSKKPPLVPGLLSLEETLF